MTNRYSFETQKILDDFLIRLENETDIDPDVLTELAQMVGNGNLGKPEEIRKVIQLLKEQQYALEN